MEIAEKSKNLMNTLITIKVLTQEKNKTRALEIIDQCFNEFDRIVSTYTRFNSKSQLSILNSNAGLWYKVDSEFFYLIKYMLYLAEITDGIFDPTVIDILEMYGYDQNYNFSALENHNLEEEIKEYLKKRPSFREIQLDESNTLVKLSKNQRIELGAVGKGYAIDRAFEILKKEFSNFLIDAGGDVRASGKGKEGKWRILLKTNSTKSSQNFIELEDESIASSGNWARKIGRFHHLINIKSGRPMDSNYNTVFVIAPTAIESDSWSTIAFLVGEDRIKEIIPPSYPVMYS